MSTLTIPRPAHDLRPTATVADLREVLRVAARVVAAIDLDDPVWDHLGPELTRLVNRVRAAAGGLGAIASARPVIAPGDEVAPVLRVRDLSRLQQRLRGVPRAAPGDGLAERREPHDRTLSVSATR